MVDLDSSREKSKIDKFRLKINPLSTNQNGGDSIENSSADSINEESSNQKKASESKLNVKGTLHHNKGRDNSGCSFNRKKSEGSHLSPLKITDRKKKKSSVANSSTSKNKEKQVRLIQTKTAKIHRKNTYNRMIIENSPLPPIQNHSP